MSTKQDSLLKKVDASKKDVIQTGFIGEAPPIKVHGPEILSEPEALERVRLVEFLKKSIEPLPVNSKSTPSQDKQLLFRKLDHMDLATARKFYANIPEMITKDVMAGKVVDPDVETKAELNARYTDISP